MTAPQTTRRRGNIAGGLALLLPAVIALVLSAWLAYEFNAEYGAVASDPVATVGSFVGGAVVTSLVVVPFAWLGLRVGWPDRRVSQFGWVLIGSLVLVSLNLVGASLIGTWEHDRGISRAETACSDSERAALTELGAVPANGEIGIGSRDGSCGATLGASAGSPAEQSALVTSVRARLASAGWVAQGPVSDAGTNYARAGRSMVVTVTTDGKSTELNATFPADS